MCNMLILVIYKPDKIILSSSSTFWGPYFSTVLDLWGAKFFIGGRSVFTMTLPIIVVSHYPPLCSLRTRPSKIEKEALVYKWGGVEMYTAGM